MNNIRLRALTMDDLNKTLTWHNQEDISEMYLGHPFPVNIEMERQWYEKTLTSNYPVTVFGIETISNSELIGLTVLKDIKVINRSAEFAIYIGSKENRGKGHSSEATKLTFDFGFKKLGLNRIFLRVIEINEPAILLYKKMGMVEEGRLRKSVFKNGVFHNEILFGLLKEEFFD